MDSRESRRLLASGAVTAAGIDHIRLSYGYLDRHDMDAYGSLLADDIQVRLPGAPVGYGRAETLRIQSEMTGASACHLINEIIAEGVSVVVIGRVSTTARSSTTSHVPDVEFADIFRLSNEGLLVEYRRFNFVKAAVPPRPPPVNRGPDPA